MRTSTRSLMKPRPTKGVMIAYLKKHSRDAFDIVREIGLTMSGVEATTKYDGSPLTDYYRRYPLVLVRLSRVDRDALADLLSVSRRLTVPKERTRGARRF